MSKSPIAAARLIDGPFSQRRTKYSSSSIFVAILIPPKVLVDAECIGEALFPDGFGCVTPPGPVDGFGKLGTSEDEDGVYAIEHVRAGKNAKELEAFMDGFFVADAPKKCLREITSREFHEAIKSGGHESVLVVEFEPD